MANIDDGFSVDLLVLGDIDADQVLIAQGGFDPSSVGYEAPEGSLFLRRDVVSLYLKTGAPDTGWSTVTAGGTDELVKTSGSDGVAGYLADKITSGGGLTVTETTGANRTLVVTLTGVTRVQTIYVGKHGNDTNSGFSPEVAKLTFGSAITAAAALTPATSNKISIICEDAGEYIESFTVPSFVLVKAPNATFVGNITLTDEAEFVFQEARASSGNVIDKTGSETGWATGEIVRAAGAANAITNSLSTSILIVRVRQIYSENGTGILDLSTGAGHIHMDVEDMYITGTGTAVDRQTNSGIVVGRISHILEQGAGIGNGTALDITNGSMNLNVGTIDTAIAYSVAGTGRLDLFCNDIVDTAQRIQLAGTAQVNVIQADSLRWRNRSTTFTARRTEFVAINTSGGAVTMNLPNPASGGDSVTFQDAVNTFSTNSLTVDAGSGGLIDDGGAGTQTIVLDVSGTAGVFIYNAVLSRWTLSRIQEEVAFSPSNLIYVTKNGNDTVGDGSFSNPYLTVKKGVAEASILATSTTPTTVKVLDGIYDEVNPITVTNPYVGIQGNSQKETIVRPTVNGQPLFDLNGNTVGEGNTLESMRLLGRNNGGTDYRDVAGGDLVRVTGDGMYGFNQVDAKFGRHGLDAGNGTISTAQNISWTNSSITDNFHGLHVGGTARLVGMSLMAVNNTVNVHAIETGRVELNGFRVCGPDPAVAGTGVLAEDTSTVILNGGLIHHLTQGIEVDDFAIVRGFSLEMRDNTNDIEQVTATARIIIQGTLSKTKQVIVDGTNISLNYTDYDTEDYIVGNVESTGNPGKEFRVREVDGRVAVGDNATDANIADGGIGGSRTINLIDTNGNMRIWRYITTDDTDPAIELIKGTATTSDGAGRPGGPNPGDPGQDIRDGTGTVWWDMFLQETDSFVIRRRTGDGGDLPNEKVRIFQDHSEWLGATQYDDSDVATMLYLQTVANATNYLQINNSVSGSGPEMFAIGTDANIDIEMTPKGSGTVIVPVGYETNIIDQSLITKAYFDANSPAVGLPVVQTRRTTTFNLPVTPAWGDLTFDLTDVETDAAVIEHNNATTQIIDIKEDGLYQISYTIPCDDEVTGRVVTDGAGGTTVIPGSQHLSGDTTDANQVIVQNSPIFFAQLSAGDELVLQVQAQTTAEVIQPGAILTVAKATGAKGEQGDPGTGATIEVRDEGVSLGTNFSSLNFVGVQVDATVGSPTSQVDITVPGKQHLSRHNGGITQTFTTTPAIINFGTLLREDTAYTHNLVGGGSEITINASGWYEISYDVSLDSPVGNSRSSSETELQLNGSQVAGSLSYGYHRTSASAEDTASATVKLNLTAGDVLRVQSSRRAGNNALVTLANACRLNISSLDG